MLMFLFVYSAVIVAAVVQKQVEQHSLMVSIAWKYCQLTIQLVLVLFSTCCEYSHKFARKKSLLRCKRLHSLYYTAEMLKNVERKPKEKKTQKKQWIYLEENHTHQKKSKNHEPFRFIFAHLVSSHFPHFVSLSLFRYLFFGKSLCKRFIFTCKLHENHKWSSPWMPELMLPQF